MTPQSDKRVDQRVTTIRPSFFTLVRSLLNDRHGSALMMLVLLGAFLLVNIEQRWSDVLSTIVLVATTAVVTLFLAAAVWTIYLYRARIVLDGDSIQLTGLFRTRRIPTAAPRSVVKFTLEAPLGRRDPMAYVLDGAGHRLFGMAPGIWREEGIESFAQALRVPIEGSYENVVFAKDLNRRYPR